MTDNEVRDDAVDGAVERVPTVGERLATTLSAERIAMHLEAGRIRLDGRTITDLDVPAPDGSRIVFAGE